MGIAHLWSVCCTQECLVGVCVCGVRGEVVKGDEVSKVVGCSGRAIGICRA